MKEYDPNFKGKHVWKVKLQQWKYFAEIEVECGGSSLGLETLECAIGFYADEHDKVYLRDKKGNTLEINFFEGEDDLKGLVVGAELLRVEDDND